MSTDGHACPTCGSKLVFTHLPGETKYRTLCDRVFRATLMAHMLGKRAIGEIATHEEAPALLGEETT
jgi:hypothetical protein